MTKAVVFDLGGVLIDWQAHEVWMEELGSRAAVDAFLTRVDFASRNLRADAGESFFDMAQELDDPEDARRLAAYVANFGRSVQNRIEESWVLLDRLRAAGVALHAITNWSAETWPEGLRAQPRLGEVFGVTVVSGQEKLLKPDAAIYQLFCQRARLAPEACVFVDDKAENIHGARAVGMDGLHFTGAAALETGLRERGLL